VKRELIITPAEGPAAGQRVLHLEGPVVLETLFTSRDALKQEMSEKLILDFTRVPYIDSAGLGSMMTTYVRYRDSGGTLALAGLNDKCRALLQMTNL
jgi:anti-anti-sigma factor